MDGVAEDLQSAAKGALEKNPAGDSPASGFIQNVAHIVLDKSDQAADSSKAYIENVVHKVQDYAQNAASGASGSTANIQATVSRAVHVGPTPGDGASSASDGGLLTSVATWCSSLCGSKRNAAGQPRGIDFQAAAQNVAQVLHSSSTTAPAEPKPEEPKPADPE